MLGHMFIIWGKKLVRRKGGFVGHFCPICRALSTFRATDIYRVPHVYFIPLGGGDAIVTELGCRGCQCVLGISALSAQPDSIEQPCSAEFAARTSPWGVDRLLARVSLEEQLGNGTLPDEARRGLLAEPFDALEYFARAKATRGSDQSITAVISLFAIIGGIASAFMWFAVFDPVPPRPPFLLWTILVTIVSVAMIAWTLYRAFRGQSRVARSPVVLAPLATALRPLHPTIVEIEQTLATLRAERSMLAIALTPDIIMSEINKHP